MTSTSTAVRTASGARAARPHGQAHALRRYTAAAAVALGAVTSGALTGGVAAAAPATQQTQQTQQTEQTQDPMAGRVTSEVLYVTTGERARQGDYPFPPYTAVSDARATELATTRARALAAGEPMTPGVQTHNSVATGWAHQREVVSRGTVPVGAHSDPHSYGTDLYGVGAGADGGYDARFELMAGPKERTAVGVASVPGTADVVVVVVNGYAAEPTVGPAVSPVDATPAGPAPVGSGPAAPVAEAIKQIAATGS